MMQLRLAFRLFWRGLTDSTFSQRVEPLLRGEVAPVAPAAVIASAISKAPMRSDALTLLAVLQREGRLVDFLKESIATYDDAQIGAAVRDIHRDCAAVVERLFEIKPVFDQPDGSPVKVPVGFDAAEYRLTGNVAGQPPYQGKLQHGGWQATKVQLPQWTGAPSTAQIIAPAEVEL